MIVLQNWNVNSIIWTILKPSQIQKIPTIGIFILKRTFFFLSSIIHKKKFQTNYALINLSWMVHWQTLLLQCLLQTMSFHLLQALQLQPGEDASVRDGYGPGLGRVLSIKNPYIIPTQIFTQGYLNLTWTWFFGHLK